MGKRLISQKRGKGSPTYTANKVGVADISYINLDEKQLNGTVKGEVIELVNDPARSAVLAKVILETGKRSYVIAAEGLRVGQQISFGKSAEIEVGNVITLGECLEGCPIFNIEAKPGDGGKFVRSSGGYALIVTKDKQNVFVKLSSGKTVSLKPNCRASIGIAAGGGRPEKPFVKAGNKFKAMKARNKWYPRVRGVAMNAVDHPFGGSQHHPGKSKSTSRHAPPGRKVGAIASKRTGRKKK